MRQVCPRWFLQCLAAVGGLIGLATAVGAADGAATVSIRLYNNAGVTERDLDAARAAAQSLLRQAGLQSVWRVCRLAVGQSLPSSVACDDVLGRAEVIVRILHGGSRDDPNSLGYSYVDTRTGTGSLTTVFANRILAVAASARIESGVLLGRVVAHEVGHLLMGRGGHSDDGLMRAHWSAETLKRNGVRDWLFSQNEAMQLRDAVVARSHLIDR
jgi:hypothetical protein